MTTPRTPDDPQDVAAQFGAIMLGYELTDQPPAPGTPLHQLQELVRRRDAGDLDDAAFRDAVQRLQKAD